MSRLEDQAFLMDSLRTTEDRVRKVFEIVKSRLGASPSIADQLLVEAMRRGNEIVDAVPRESSTDHAYNFACLATLLLGHSAAPRTIRPLPSIDPGVRDAFGLWSELSFIEHLRVSVANGYWESRVVDGALRFGLQPPFRRSALHLLSNKAEYLAASPEMQDLMSNPQAYPDPDTSVRFSLDTVGSQIQFIADALPDSWNKLYRKLPFSFAGAQSFRVFCTSVGHLGDYSPYARWFRRENLWHLWGRFVQKYQVSELDEAEFDSLLHLFSLTPAEAVEWGVVAPFLRLGEDYGHWFFSSHVMHPDLNYLALLVRRFPQAWSDTVGGDLAAIASWLKSRLPASNEILTATECRRKGLGDIDLAVFDPRCGSLLLCEIKTTFDKFRTNRQLSDYAEKRVDFTRARGQLAKNISAVTSGEWPVDSIFRTKVGAAVREVTPLLLTWWDQYNPTLGSSGEIITMNFRTFIYLMEQTRGDLPLFTQASRDLSHCYCPAHLQTIYVRILDKMIPVVREMQTDLLPPASALRAQSEWTLSEMKTLAHFPDDWRQQDPAGNWYFYL